MKKILSIIFICLLSYSCRRYECECVIRNLYNPETSGVGYSKEYKKSDCLAKSTSPDANGNYYVCDVK